MITCKECKERLLPDNPEVAHYNYKYGWRIPSECEMCRKPQSERDVQTTTAVIKHHHTDLTESTIERIARLEKRTADIENKRGNYMNKIKPQGTINL